VNRRRVGTSLHAGLLFAVLGAVAWASGEPFVFPSLGPSAFLLAFERRAGRTRAYRVVGGHLVGAVAGFLAYALLATGVSLTATPPPGSGDGLRLALSGTLSMVLTAWGLLATDTVHAPACATTLIVSLGLLSTPFEVGLIVLSVVVLVGCHVGTLRAVERVLGEPSPRHAAE
jgi:hypothetical protein